MSAPRRSLGDRRNWAALYVIRAALSVDGRFTKAVFALNVLIERDDGQANGGRFVGIGDRAANNQGLTWIARNLRCRYGRL